ncbi:hypothetical protein LX16_2856 [Stackebrandtia albiflava]|uniref:Metallothionein n=1 Tax=Stackebrandtia albiflava TaxID=406432 RepID=A0A562V2M2_9ACTN|nr:hypothetical protein [Stackebrandtia albiflava]TWJ12108.1 hypothetical protein LX16_2856 [Stackebrandtia albiflava]
MSRLTAWTDGILDALLRQGQAEAACGSWYCVSCWCPGGSTGCRECRVCDGVRTCKAGCNC